MSSGILFLAHRLPFPPDRGDKIRSFHVLKALAKIAPVYVGCLAESKADFLHLAELEAVATSWCMPLRSKPLGVAGIEAMLAHEPVSFAAFHNAQLERWVKKRLRRRGIDTIYVFSGQMGQYIPADWQGSVVLDLVDVDSAKFEAFAEKQAWPTNWVNQREGRLLRRQEARLAARAEHTLLVSEAEVELLRQRLPAGSPAHVSALGNGIDTAHFNPEIVPPHIAIANAQGPHFVFTGQMDYAPNVDAVMFAMREVMPRIREVHPHASFHVVGRAPDAKLQALDGQDGCRIWGEVPDTRPFLAAADIVLAPLNIARGVQNKVLEAMAMARPTVLSCGAASGIPAQDGKHFAVADGAEEMLARIFALLENRIAAATMGNSARQFVMETMSWESALAGLPALLGRTGHHRNHRDAA